MIRAYLLVVMILLMAPAASAQWQGLSKEDADWFLRLRACSPDVELLCKHQFGVTDEPGSAGRMLMGRHKEWQQCINGWSRSCAGAIGKGQEFGYSLERYNRLKQERGL